MHSKSIQTSLVPVLIIILVVFLGACSSNESPGIDGNTTGSSPAGSASGQASEAATSQVEPTPTVEMETVYLLGEGQVQVPLEPPATFDELLEKNVEQGIWERGEGLALLLGYFAGEVESDSIAKVSEVVAGGATGLMREGQDFLAEMPDSPYSEEIGRLLDELVPTQEELDRLSEPSSQSGNAGTYTVSYGGPAQGYGGCELISGDGFSKNVDPGEACYKYKYAELNGHEYRVYYPRSWEDEEAKTSLVDTTLEALVDSASTYSTLRFFGSVNAVFSMSQPEDSPTTLAYEVAFPSDEPCPITILPLSLESGGGAYKQTIAHESFHCFQDWNFNMSPYSVHKWWGEGSAEYFSNVVYPESNDEHGWLRSYYNRSIYQPWFDMSYHNFLLFQFFGNRLGNPRLISLLDKISTSGGIAGQASFLASYQNMDQLFSEFVVATMSRGVQDTGGGMIVSNRFRVRRIETIEKEGEKQFVMDPFVAGRFLVNYKQEKRFLEKPEEDEFVRHSMAITGERRNLGAWSELPPEVRSDCDRDEKYVLAVTSVQSSGTLTANIEQVEKAECDPCLLGAWDIDADSFEVFLDRLIEQTGMNSLPISGSPEVEIGGHDYLQFGEDGKLQSRRVDFQLSIGINGAPALVTTTDAQGSGDYSADGETLEVMNMVDRVNKIEASPGGSGSMILNPQTGTVSIFGQIAPAPGLTASEDLPSESAQYTCRQKTLSVTIPEYGEVIYNRVDQIIPTPVPTPSQ